MNEGKPAQPNAELTRGQEKEAPVTPVESRPEGPRETAMVRSLIRDRSLGKLPDAILREIVRLKGKHGASDSTENTTNPPQSDSRAIQIVDQARSLRYQVGGRLREDPATFLRTVVKSAVDKVRGQREVVLTTDEVRKLTELRLAIWDLLPVNVDAVDETRRNQSYNDVWQNRGLLEKAVLNPHFRLEALKNLGIMLDTEDTTLQSFALNRIDRSLPLIRADLASNRSTDQYAEVVSKVVEHGTAKQKTHALPVLEQCLPQIAAAVSDVNLAYLYDYPMKVLTKAGNPQAIEIAQNALEDPDQRLSQKTRYLSMLLTSDDEQTRLDAHTLGRKVLGEIMAEEPSQQLADRLIRGWAESTIVNDIGGKLLPQKEIEKNFTKNVERNMQRIQWMESQAPGSVAAMEKLFGIRNFHRYDAEQLLRQYKERDTNRSYVVVATALNDHNGAFSFAPGDAEKIAQMTEELNKNNYAVRYIEFGTKVEVLGRLHMLDKLYGSENKIGGMVVQAHGEKEGMTLSEATDPLTVVDIQRYASDPRIQEFFDLDAPITYLSCGAGEKEGAAEATARSLGTAAVGPDAPVGVYSVTPHFSKDGKLTELKPTYSEKDSAKVYAWKRGENQVVRQPPTLEEYLHAQEKALIERPQDFEVMLPPVPRLDEKGNIANREELDKFYFGETNQEQ